ncbi:hypothetical protein ABIF68_010744 [Bradyrhizobium japonicum]|uniref:outer membrane protein n=1 Tax=Bradyrhizobium TaxID=374 RepID=UPI001F0A1D4D|nr:MULTISPECIES: hypothetical protein [Bradyrhizobium]MDI2078033.1 hypothetical protein [Bradyrhizobium sp. Mp27]
MAIATTGTAMAKLGREALPPSVWNWSGGYIGGHVGGGYGRTSFTNPFGPPIYGDVVDIPSFVAGGQIGYNWQNNSWVYGLELDASAAVASGSNTCLAASDLIVSANCNAAPNLFATGTGRIGYAFGSLGQTLAYLKAGAACKIIEATSSTTLKGATCHRRKPISTMAKLVASSGSVWSKPLRLHGR